MSRYVPGTQSCVCHQYPSVPGSTIRTGGPGTVIIESGMALLFVQLARLMLCILAPESDAALTDKGYSYPHSRKRKSARKRKIRKWVRCQLRDVTVLFFKFNSCSSFYTESLIHFYGRLIILFNRMFLIYCI